MQGFELAHNLDQDEALASFRAAVAADPKDPAAHRAVAAIAWLKILFQRGVVTFDDYLGRLSAPNVPMRPPPPALAAMFREHIDQALALAEAGLKAAPGNPDAHYQVGATVGLLASYSSAVEGHVLQSIRAARRAFHEHETVLKMNPRRTDAGLIVGMYRYGVANLSAPIRLLAYAAGFGGGREQGIRLIEEAATYRQDLHTDPLYALMVIYVRERRYGDAAGTIAELQRLYPRNRLLWLNAGANALLAGRPADAETVLTEGLERLHRDPRPRAFGEEAVWKYKRGAARVALGRVADAEGDLRDVLHGDAREWVRGRAHLELGKLADLSGERTRAREEYEAAISLSGRDNDPVGVGEAKRFLRSPYRNAGRP